MRWDHPIWTFLYSFHMPLSIYLPVGQSCFGAPVLAAAELFVCLGVVLFFCRRKLTWLLLFGET